MRALTVVRLGGSLALSPFLKPWLAALARQAGRIVVVPGGGPFADSVRQAQEVMGFDDVAAHHMALLAMEQYGRALAGLAGSLVPAAEEEQMRAIVADGRVPVWCPLAMVSADPNLPASWTVTSDSLALWLARRLDASRMVLIKSTNPGAEFVIAARLSAAGMIDEVFEGLMAGWGGEAWFAGPQTHDQLETLVAGRMVGSSACARIDLAVRAPAG